jgi:hypothetical protein
MRTGFCSVCSHRQHEAINQALIAKSVPLRALADRHGLSKTALLRHKEQHLEGEIVAKAAKDADQSEEAAAIDLAMAKIKKAEKRADRTHDLTAKLQISRELRALLELKSKIRARHVPEKATGQGISRREALETAKEIIEIEVAAGAALLSDWLAEMLVIAENHRAATTPVTTVGVHASEEEGVSA